MLAVEDLHERTVEAAGDERLTLVADSEHVSPGGALTFKITVLLKPLSAVRVTVEFPSDPAFTVIVVGAVVIVKSTTWNVIVAL